MKKVFHKLSDQTLDHLQDIFKLNQNLITYRASSTAYSDCWVSIQKYFNITIDYEITNSLTSLDEFLHTVEKSEIIYHAVSLKENWWLQDNGILLAFYNDTLRPCVLIPQQNGYQLFDSESSENDLLLVNEKIATQLNIEAYSFTKKFPQSALTIGCLTSFVMSNQKQWLAQIFKIHLILAILSLLFPVFTGKLLGQFIPDGNMNEIKQFILLLFSNTIILWIFSYVQMILYLQFSVKSSSNLQTALWDRILTLPTIFFNSFSTGDLASRIEGFEQLQEGIIQNLFDISGCLLIMLFNLILMIYCSLLLGLMVIFLALIYFSFFIWNEIRAIQKLSHVYILQGKLSGFILQCINGIAKLKTTHAEQRVFSKWIANLIKITHYEYKSGHYGVLLATFNIAFFVSINAMLFGVLMYFLPSLSLTKFIIFNSAFTLFFSRIFTIFSSFEPPVFSVAIVSTFKTITRNNS